MENFKQPNTRYYAMNRRQ